MIKAIFLISFLLFVTYIPVLCLEDPYQILGVHRSASITEIKSAYKKLAKEWHPDKNKNPSAEETFIEINKAYQLLSDPARREEFDRFGTTEDKPNFRKTSDYSQFNRFDHFDSFFNGAGFQFKFTSSSGSIYHKHTITSKAYYNNVIAGSSKQPYLIMFYSSFCIPCMQTESLWSRITEEFQPLGIGVGCIHAEHEEKLAYKLGVNSVPYLIGIIDGRVKHYREEQFSLKKSIDFTKRLFPYDTIKKIDSKNYFDSFLNGWSQDNKVRVLICSRLENIRLRFYTTAFKFRERAAFAYAQLGTQGTDFLTNDYGLNQVHTEYLLVFHEDRSSPSASLSMVELSVEAMDNVIEANKYLSLPRLSSQEIFNNLCPPEAAKTRKKLCVVLVTHNSPSDDEYRSSLRSYLHTHYYNKKRVQFAYIFEEKQKEFMKAISEGKSDFVEPSVVQIVIIWRRDFTNVKYVWLKEGWSLELDKINSSMTNLESTVQNLLKTSDSLPYNAVLSDLKNEHELNMISRLANKVFLFVDSVQERITKEQVLPIVSIILTAGFILLVGFGMTYLLKIEEEALNQKYGKSKRTTVEKQSTFEPSLKIHELRGETYFGLLRLLKPGYRTILLLLDNDSKDILMPKFFKAVFPYRKNKSLMFAFLNLDRNLDWYRGLLIQALTSPRDLNINPKNCIGTVLSINGLRKYFCMYHPKHPEQPRGEGNLLDGGEFMGFEDSEPDSENSDIECGNTNNRSFKDESLGSVIFDENLLDKFNPWLERLFEGTTQRYYFQVWPNLRY